MKQVAEKFNVSHGVVRNWIERKFIDARRIGPKTWISISLEQELELKKYIDNSSKIATARLKSQKQT
ncbi:hypothetical protein HCR15_04755 [Wolbachia pipientis]|uniref:hypothetical protein n=1 Tax=Wolbachia TaxID=953 RepID=UPI0015FBD5E2|nr:MULTISPECIES: hypothetical protein [Wolbachia]MBA8756366.1 hypothetical protein [Wolbachia pipientis]MDE5066786.1 hypothetical protein [Wolbachia endosymbiont of Drosophila leontia]